MKTAKPKNVDEYKPYNGFYDLRDFKLPKRLFRQLWIVQGALYNMAERQAYFKKWHPGQWQKAKEVSAEYQSLLFQHSLKFGEDEI